MTDLESGDFDHASAVGFMEAEDGETAKFWNCSLFCGEVVQRRLCVVALVNLSK